MKGDWEAPGRKPPPDGIFPFKINAQIAKVTTMVDGSYRCILDFGEDNTPEAAKLLACRRLVVQVEFQKRITGP